MTAVVRGSRHIVRSALENPLALLIGAAILLAAASGAFRFSERRIGVPVPLVVYEIESVSGPHHATLAGLPLPAVGVPVVPIPVDVNGDRVPDLTVSLNLIDAAGLFDNPPDLNNVVAPNLEINRLMPGVPIGPVNAPLRINVKLTILNVGGTPPATVLRLGYETGPGGSIPSKFKLVANGLTGFFNPVTASVDAPGYEGPLTVVAGIEEGSRRADVDARFAPFPSGLQISYGSDSAGQHINASHAGAVGPTAADREVDLNADVKIVDGAEVSTIRTRVDRLPHSVGLTIQPGQEGGGGLDYAGSVDGRLPDVRVDVTNTPPSGPPLVARVDVEALPPEVHAQWSLAPDGPLRLKMTSPVRPIGAIEARVANFTGTPSALPTYIPTAQQFVDIREAASTGERLIAGRIEGISVVELTQTEQGVDSRFETGGGGRPVELHASLPDVGTEHRRIDATTTISPLPAKVSASLTDSGENQATDPLKLAYESSDSIDVDGHVEVRDTGVPGTAACGARGTLCADLHVRDIPSKIEARIARIKGDDEESDARITIDAIPRLNASSPDVFADLVMASEDGDIVEAHAKALAIPEHMTLRLAKNKAGDLARAEFHACELDYGTGLCAENSEGAVGAFDFTAQNFLEANRSPKIPAPVLDRSQHIVVVGSGSAAGAGELGFQAAGRFTRIKEVEYLGGDATGIRVRAGADEEFLGQVGLHDVDSDADDDENELVDLDAELHVPKLPGELNICLRPQGKEPVATPTDPVTGPCESTTPFGPTVDLDGSPLSVGYRADKKFDIDGSVHLRGQGRKTATAADVVTDDSVVDATLNVAGLPKDLLTHLLLPADEGEPDGPSRAVRAHFFASEQPASIGFSGASLRGGAVCQDPRPGADAMCVAGNLTDFPSTIDLYLDPSKLTSGPVLLNGTDNNFVLTTDGGSATKLTGFTLSSVTPVKDSDPVRSDAVVIDGSLTGIPAKVVGKLRTPRATVPGDEPQLEFLADPRLGELSLGFRNFLPPDTFDAVPVAHATAGAPPGPADQQVAVQAIGDMMKASVSIKDLTRVAFRPVRDADDKPLGTKVVSLGFGDAVQTARLYADIQKLSKGSPERLLADVVLNDLPTSVDVCVRGERDADAAEPAGGTGTWCDDVGDTAGAFRVHVPDGESRIDADVYARHEKTGGSKMLAARLQIKDLPPTLRVEIPSGTGSDLDLQGLRGANDDIPQGIGRVDVEVAASRDILVDGWATNADRPFTRRALPDRLPMPFPAEGSANQHLSVAAAEDVLHLRGRLGDLTENVPDSKLQRLRMLARPCAAPPNSPPDYPYYPDGAKAAESRCIAATFDPSDPGDPLDLNFTEGVASVGGDVLRFHHGGLTDIPPWFQMTLTKTAQTNGAHDSLRPRCGPAAANPPSSLTDDCMPPIVRFDQPLATSQLFGVLEKGDPLVLFVAETYEPDTNTPTCPSPEACAPELDAIPAPNDPGIRAKVLNIKPSAAFPPSTGVRVAFRLALPQSLTVEQPQSWSAAVSTNPAETAEKAKDARFAYAVRDANGKPVESLGRLAAFIQDEFNEIVLTDPADPTKGVVLPGEFGLDLYLRDSKVQGRLFAQIDGRTSSRLSAALRMFDGLARPSDIDESTSVDAAGLDRMSFALVDLQPTPAGAPASAFDEPSFRLRLEVVKPTEAPGTPDPSHVTTSHSQFMGTVDATLDLDVDDHPARAMEAVILLNGSQVGGEFAAFADLDSRTPAHFSLDGVLDFDHMNYRFHDGPGDTDIRVVSTLKIPLHVEKAEGFRLRNKVASIDLEVFGPSSSASIGPMEWVVDDFYVEVDSGYWVQAQVNFDASADPVAGHWRTCATGHDEDEPMDEAALVVSGDPGGHNRHFSGSINIFRDGRFDADVKYVPGDAWLTEDTIKSSAMDMLCGMHPGTYELIRHADPSDPVLHPGDPLAVTGHDVPPADPNVPPSGTVPPLGGDGVSTTAPPDFTVSEPITLCGFHRFGTLEVNAPHTLSVGATPDSTLTPFALHAKCPGGAVGTLTIVADFVKIHHGAAISASAILTTPAPVGEPSGNGGGSHGGPGGDGSVGVAGPVYGNTAEDQKSPFTERGMPGGPGPAGSGGGAAGGLITIASERIDVDGRLEADGGHGTSRPCDAQHVPGSGGGSGGGISLFSLALNVFPGEVSAIGGNGGSGWGGGGAGGGGIVKIRVPNYFDDGPLLGGGYGGESCADPLPDPPEPPACTGEGLPGCDNGGGLDWEDWIRHTGIGVAKSIARVDGSGTAHTLTTGWTFTDALSFGFKSVVGGPPISEENPDGGNYVAFACLVRADDVTQTFTMPASTTTSPCGGGEPSGGVLVRTQGQDTDATDTANSILVGDYVIDSPLGPISINPPPMPDGIYGVWVDVCLVNSNNFCQGVPVRPDRVFGLDTVDPVVTIDTPGLPQSSGESLFFGQATRSNTVLFETGAVHGPSESPILYWSCNISSTLVDPAALPEFAWRPCGEGQQTRKLTDGVNWLSVRAIDSGGLSGYDQQTVLVDHTIPGAQIVVEELAPLGAAGWMRTAPAVKVKLIDGDSGLNATPLVYTIDGGEERTMPRGACVNDFDFADSLVCQIPQGDLNALGQGTHRIRFTGVDVTGNRQYARRSVLHPEWEMGTAIFKIDRDHPVTALATAPESADGNNDWFVTAPVSVATARENLGGSGLAKTEVTINGVTKDYIGPEVLGAGTNHVCVKSIDIAGNPEASHCIERTVDLADPDITIDAPLPPASGWFAAPPTVTVTGGDALSGVDTAGGPASDCLVEAPDEAVSRICVSVDGGEFRPSTGSYVIPEGVHSVRAFSVDRAGRRSAVVGSTFNVDLSTPVVTGRVMPPAPARGSWYRRLPTFVLRATDGEANAGIDRIEYKLDGGPFQNYTAAFELTAGLHAVTYRAFDKAGLASGETTVALSTDTGSPLATAVGFNPATWSKLLGPTNVKMDWVVGDDRSGRVRVEVLVIGTAGNVIRRVDAGTVTVVPGTPKSGFATWDGKNSAGAAVLGVFHFRVLVTDEAGNRSESGESRPIQIRLL